MDSLKSLDSFHINGIISINMKIGLCSCCYSRPWNLLVSKSNNSLYIQEHMETVIFHGAWRRSYTRIPLCMDIDKSIPGTILKLLFGLISKVSTMSNNLDTTSVAVSIYTNQTWRCNSSKFLTFVSSMHMYSENPEWV